MIMNLAVTLLAGLAIFRPSFIRPSAGSGADFIICGSAGSFDRLPFGMLFLSDFDGLLFAALTSAFR
ncbi:hypothetical protein PO124_25170 [Bacillus licheniformis]|nr:hypothetical protein [Bacillus licheniformis]